MKDKIRCWIFCFLFFGGFLLAGSEGPHFPWPNLIGAAMAALGIPLIPAIERCEDERDGE